MENDLSQSQPNQDDLVEVLRAISQAQENLRVDIQKAATLVDKRQKRRDAVLASVGFVVALLGVYVTYRHNNQQNQIEEARTLQALLPATVGPGANVDTRRAAVGVVKSHGSPRLSARYATNLSDLGEHLLATDLAASGLKLALEKSALSRNP